jgi:hypothetical protein
VASYEAFLDRLRTGRLPPYGALRWDGEAGEVITSVNFEIEKTDTAAEVRERAHRYFSQLTPAEWRVLDIEVITRAGKPVRATLKPLHGGVIQTSRLRQLEETLAKPPPFGVLQNQKRG